MTAKAILALLILISPIQDAISLLKEMRKVYDGNDVRMDYQMTYIDHHGGREVYEQGVIAYTTYSYFSKRNDVIVFFDSIYDLEIDLLRKQINVQNTPTGLFVKRQPQDINSLILQMESDSILHVEQSLTHWILETDLPQYKCTYFLKKESFHLTQVEYNLKTDQEYQQLVLDFKNISINDDSIDFPRGHQDFLKITESQIQGVGDFAGFTITDNRN